MKNFDSLPVRQQYALGALWMLPWVAFGILGTDILPKAARFQTWPEGVRMLCIIAFVIFSLADLLFALWWLFARLDEDSRKK